MVYLTDNFLSISEESNMKYVYEAIGTFFLVLTIGMVVIEPGSAGNLAPLAIGTVLAVMIFAGGHVSGGHYNPAVSLAVYLRGKSTLNDMLIYWAVQVVAGVVAGFIVLYIKGAIADAAGTALAISAIDVNTRIIPAFLAEFIGTFALTFTVLNVATARATENNSYFGWAIGMAVMAMAYAFGSITGGGFNPAVAFGISVMGLTTWSGIWLYIVAELAAGAVAAVVFKAAHPVEDKTTAPAPMPSQQRTPPSKSAKR